jgi:hypothetical protein
MSMSESEQGDTGGLPPRVPIPVGASQECIDCHNNAWAQLLLVWAFANQISDPLWRQALRDFAHAYYLETIAVCPCTGGEV